MTNEELQIAKERSLYKNQLKDLKDEILLLEQHPKVKEYFSLVKELEEKIKEDKPITITRESSNNLLFGYGRFSIRESKCSYFSNVYIYRDLETCEYFYYTAYYTYKKIFRTFILEKEELEKMDNEFERMREYFFEQLLNKPQEQVVYEILENNKRLVKGRKNELLF